MDMNNKPKVRAIEYLKLLKEGKRVKITQKKDGIKNIIKYEGYGMFSVFGNGSLIDVKEIFFMHFMEWYCSGKFDISVLTED